MPTIPDPGYQAASSAETTEFHQLGTIEQTSYPRAGDSKNGLPVEFQSNGWHTATTLAFVASAGIMIWSYLNDVMGFWHQKFSLPFLIILAGIQVGVAASTTFGNASARRVVSIVQLVVAGFSILLAPLVWNELLFIFEHWTFALDFARDLGLIGAICQVILPPLLAIQLLRSVIYEYRHRRALSAEKELPTRTGVK